MASSTPTKPKFLRRPLRRAAAVASLLALAACVWSQTTVATRRIVPGALALPGVGHLILSDFDGPGGEEVAHAVAAKLLQRRSFAVTDLTSQRRFFAGLSQQALQRGDAQEATVGEAGILASVVQHEIEDDLTYEEQAWGEAGVATTYVRGGTLHLQVHFRAVDPYTGAMFDARPIALHLPLGDERVVVPERAVADAEHIQSYFPARDHAALFFAAYAKLAEDFCDAVQLHEEVCEVEVYHNRYDPAAERALQAIKRGDWAAVVAFYRDGLTRLEATGSASEDHRAMAHYNLGVAWAYSGDLERGLQELAWSQAIKDGPLVQQELAKVRNWSAEARRPLK